MAGAPLNLPNTDNGPLLPSDKVGKRFLVKRVPGGDEVAAEIVQHRPSPDSYYVHYEGSDRRLDEWVSADRIGKQLEEEVSKKRKSPGGNLSRSNSATQLKSPTNGDDDDESRNRTARLWQHNHGHGEHTKVRNISKVQLGKYEIECWYYSPYPGEYATADKLYVCECCFKYTKKEEAYLMHLSTCRKDPPGRKIYEDYDRNIAVFEVDGAAQRLYGQNLCLFGKLFIEHKTMYYNPEPFHFYILLERDSTRGSMLHPVGYFSKEKDSQDGYNLACILTLPPYQRKGYGKFIISLSYELSKLQGITGSPEKPLSDLGKLSYRSYWSFQILKLLSDREDVTMRDMCKATGIRSEDIISTLESLHLLKFLKGQYVAAISKPIVQALLKPYLDRHFARPFCKSRLLKWTPPPTKPSPHS